jgi:hypothetical protein
VIETLWLTTHVITVVERFCSIGPVVLTENIVPKTTPPSATKKNITITSTSGHQTGFAESFQSPPANRVDVGKTGRNFGGKNKIKNLNRQVREGWGTTAMI